jgi:membrane-bound serine protease (ClpP class)
MAAEKMKFDMRNLLFSYNKTFFQAQNQKGGIMDIIIITIVLQIAGTLAILAELLVPSLGLLTVAAVGFFAYSYYLVWTHSPTAIIFLIVINLISIPATLIFTVKKLKKTKSLTLNDKIDSEGFVSPVEIGEEGVAITDLRPAGTAKIGDRHIDVYSEGGYILKGTKIKVLSVQNAGVKVTSLEE